MTHGNMSRDSSVSKLYEALHATSISDMDKYLDPIILDLN